MTTKLPQNLKAQIVAALPEGIKNLLVTAHRLEDLGCRVYTLEGLGNPTVQNAFVRGLLIRKSAEDRRVCLSNKGLFYAALITT
jgi:hypothetical protein